MTLFECANPLNIASTDYVDCVITTVSGSLQNQINSAPGIWIELASFSTSISDENTIVTVSGLPEMDVLKVFVLVQGLYSDPAGSPFILYFNDDFNYLNYLGAGLIVLTSPNMLDVPTDSFIERTIVNIAENRKIVYTSGSFADSENLSDTNDGSGYWASGWNNTTDRISSMSFGFSTVAPVTSGSIDSFRVKILGMNF